MNTANSIKLYELSQEFVKDKEKAKTFVEKIEALVDDKMEQRFEYLATKSDLADLKVELLAVIRQQKEDLMQVIGNQKEDLMQVIGNQKEDLMQVIGNQKGDLTRLIYEQKDELLGAINTQRTDLVKSIYMVGLIQFLAIVGSVIAIFSVMLH